MIVNQGSATADEQINVTAKISDLSIPGAIICKDYDTVEMSILIYRDYSQKILRQSIFGKKQEQLLHGDSIKPNIEKYGCIMVKSGTAMLWDGNPMPAIVTVKLNNGKTYTGVTDPSMIKNGKECRTVNDCDDYYAGKSKGCYITQICE